MAFMVLIAAAACRSKASPSAPSVSLISTETASSVFVQNVEIAPSNIGQISTVGFVVHTKPGNLAKDINVSYSIDYLNRSGYVHTDTGIIDVPVFGLYQGYVNHVDVVVTWQANVSDTIPLTLQTGNFMSDYMLTGVTVSTPYINPTTSYILIDSAPISPIVIDIDGEVRWQSPVTGMSAMPTYFDGSKFIEGQWSLSTTGTGNNVFSIALSGAVSPVSSLTDTRYSNFHHDIEPGKQGLIAPVTFYDNSNPAAVIDKYGSVLIEMTPLGSIFNTWDFDQILSSQIVSKGENPSTFIQSGVDWFHMNSAIYVPQDDSLIVSSRENFVIKIDYSTKKIKWILGNPAKQWYQNYPLSLRPLALNITGNAPIGQHAVSIVGDPNHLLLFNNGYGNLALPYVGDSRTYSSVSFYEIDENLMTANEIWSFDDNQALYSPICGSAVKTAFGLYLVDFATTESETAARIMLVDDSKNILFDMRIPKRSVDQVSCLTAYRAREIKLESLAIQ